ncbi:MAG: hypothetical protein NW241_10365 [Bacteroidia bacterium]|nr:hypothetical protein [Bacteroidia bacterium]
MKQHLVWIACLLATAAQAQEIEGRSSFYLAVGAHALQLPELNARLDALDLPQAPGAMTVSGFGGMYANRIVMGGEGFTVAQFAIQGSRAVDLAGGAGYGFLGYEFVRTKRLSLYPLLGIGGGGLRISLQEQPDEDQFDAYAQGNAAGATFSSGWLLGQAALGLNYYGTYGQLMGLRIGAYTSPSRAWESPFGELQNAPSDRLTGFYFSLLFGLHH